MQLFELKKHHVIFIRNVIINKWKNEKNNYFEDS